MLFELLIDVENASILDFCTNLIVINKFWIFQDLLVQRAIMQANIWNPTKYKLPRRFNPRLPGWHFKAEFGISNLLMA